MDAPRSARSYLVCSTPRSGSTLLCETLSDTGVAGRPAEYFEALRGTGLPRQPREYFHGLEDPEVHRLLAPTEPGRPEPPGAFAAALARALREGTTPNGVFGVKMMWGYFLDLAARLRELPGLARLRVPEALAHALPGLRYVHVARDDKVAQAVSLWTAVQTHRWRDDASGGPDHEPVYSFAAIDHLVAQLEAQDRAWQQWFLAAGVEPVRVRYDDLVADPSGTVLWVLDELGIPADRDVVLPPPRLRQQAGARSREWADRYVAQRAAAA